MTTQIGIKIAPPDHRSTDFQTHLERRFMPVIENSFQAVH